MLFKEKINMMCKDHKENIIFQLYFWGIIFDILMIIEQTRYFNIFIGEDHVSKTLPKKYSFWCSMTKTSLFTNAFIKIFLKT